jgi:antitoxin YefM
MSRGRVYLQLSSTRRIDRGTIISYNKNTKKHTDFNIEMGVLNMLAVKSMDVRDNFKALCDKVFGGETLIVSRPKNENIVMMSEQEYNELQKAKRNAEYLAMLDKSMAEAEAGNFIVKSIEELEAYEK